MNQMQILAGTIVHGKALGRTVGMPTANLKVEQGKLPDPGVYATKIIFRGYSYTSVTNIGNRPSVDSDQTVTVETYIFDFEDDIYGEYVVLEIYQFLRPIMKFKNLEEVKKQVKKDIRKVKLFFEGEKNEDSNNC